MNKIETDHTKNLLVIPLNGFHGTNREIFVADIEAAANTLPLGFSCIIILSEDTVVSQKELRDLENLLYAYGLSEVVYVGGNHCSSYRHKEFSDQTGIRINQANTLEEAEAVLSTQSIQ